MNTADRPLTEEEKQYIGLDCEMVGIDPRSTSVLAHVVLVNWNGHEIYNSYVKPPAPVTNYRTQYSGIVAGNLETKGRPFKRVQAEVANLIRGKIVVGHGLANDFKSLHLPHPPLEMIRDTTLRNEFKKPDPRTGALNPQKLSKLALEHLGVAIQQGTHDPAEDARASMALFRMFKNVWPAPPTPKRSFASVAASSRTRTRRGGTRKRRGSSKHRAAATRKRRF